MFTENWYYFVLANCSSMKTCTLTSIFSEVSSGYQMSRNNSVIILQYIQSFETLVGAVSGF